MARQESIAGIGKIEPKKTMSIELNEHEILHKARTRNVCLDGSQFRALGQNEKRNEIDTIRCGKTTRFPSLDQIDGDWPYSDDEYFDS